MRIEHALGIEGAKSVRVRGFLLCCDEDPVRLCAELLESMPPQCGGASLIVEGVEMSTLAGTVRSEDCVWTVEAVELEGIVENGVLRVG